MHLLKQQVFVFSNAKWYLAGMEETRLAAMAFASASTVKSVAVGFDENKDR